MDENLRGLKQVALGPPRSLESKLDPSLKSVLVEILGTRPDWSASGREEVAKALLDYSWTQRLYFIVRSGVMGVLGVIVTASVVAAIGLVNALETVFIGLVSFVVTLAITRVFDVQINRLSKTIVRYISRYERLRKVVVDHL